ncbi:hypothetical protein HK100_008501 [Physocladia obscura]|uniref:Uncharacterized protein n=1 Tax=Physocladia obscura TaxID=109957 RepID=A0AAD5T440_9FUNG|nr:hypothetical protein HK100_008501 [Physocladia obscura]
MDILVTGTELLQLISTTNSSTDGSVPNTASFFLSTAGYGILRNTFTPGQYSFKSTLTLQHNELQYDAYIILDPTGEKSLKNLLTSYTALSGRPDFLPYVAFELGDSKCYNGSSEVFSIVDKYASNDLPLGWLLVDDGINGCKFTNYSAISNVFAAKNVSVGLSEDLLNTALLTTPAVFLAFNTSVRKLNVASNAAGSTNLQSLQACNSVHDSIEANKSVRALVLMRNAWTGSQRCAIAQSGNQNGSFENVRMHIPTFQGAGMSGFVYATGDVDGVYGGTAESYTRDLQHKIFSPIVSVRGDSSSNKHPWVFGEPYTTINRKYLKLRVSLLPYIYSLAYQAYLTGIPLVRPIALEFPNDPNAFLQNMSYQFMFGSEFLVAPVYIEGAITRDYIYFPNGTWFDFWSLGTYTGPQKMRSYHAPLDILPLFVKSGSIIPQYTFVPAGNQKPTDADSLTLQVYPAKGKVVEFILYADDRKTQDYQLGAYATQKISADYTDSTMLIIIIGSNNGEYSGKPQSRKYVVNLYITDKIIGSSFPYKQKANGVVCFTLQPINSDQEAVLIIYTAITGAQDGGHIQAVGTVLVAIIILGLLLAMDKTENQDDDFKPLNPDKVASISRWIQNIPKLEEQDLMGGSSEELVIREILRSKGKPRNFVSQHTKKERERESKKEAGTTEAISHEKENSQLKESKSKLLDKNHSSVPQTPHTNQPRSTPLPILLKNLEFGSAADSIVNTGPNSSDTPPQSENASFDGKLASSHFRIISMENCASEDSLSGTTKDKTSNSQFSLSNSLVTSSGANRLSINSKNQIGKVKITARNLNSSSSSLAVISPHADSKNNRRFSLTQSNRSTDSAEIENSRSVNSFADMPDIKGSFDSEAPSNYFKPSLNADNELTDRRSSLAHQISAIVNLQVSTQEPMNATVEESVNSLEQEGADSGSVKGSGIFDSDESMLLFPDINGSRHNFQRHSICAGDTIPAPKERPLLAKAQMKLLESENQKSNSMSSDNLTSSTENVFLRKLRHSSMDFKRNILKNENTTESEESCQAFSNSDASVESKINKSMPTKSKVTAAMLNSMSGSFEFLKQSSASVTIMEPNEALQIASGDDLPIASLSGNGSKMSIFSSFPDSSSQKNPDHALSPDRIIKSILKKGSSGRLSVTSQPIVSSIHDIREKVIRWDKSRIYIFERSPEEALAMNENKDKNKKRDLMRV